ncbi:DUF2306 domain-containing protein [Anatilimnocola floriformis]|uniref:DUF2306 domain-containing protein n=1 Tax=Anatilimnocola floriformis TaxID=2948575 RepID=UPI0020C23463|nr:DUF2306 domain-containing protein [Anatilimnocola floriformis]
MNANLRKILLAAITLLGVRVLIGIVWEYRLYFPPNFQTAAFLIGREETFTPLYAAAFYSHIISGPPAILLAAFLLWSSSRSALQKAHRWAGRILGVLVFAVLLPSGLWMAGRAFAGPLAGIGFASLTLSTACTLGKAISLARRRKFALHQQWAIRTFLLLASPLLLRVIGGALSVSGWDIPAAYIANAWLSWLVPLAGYEVWLRSRPEQAVPRAVPARPASES